MRALSPQRVAMMAAVIAAASKGPSKGEERRFQKRAEQHGRQVACWKCHTANVTLYKVAQHTYACAKDRHLEPPISHVVSGGDINPLQATVNAMIAEKHEVAA